MINNFEDLIKKAKEEKPINVAVVNPTDVNSLSGALASADEGIIIPFLFGEKAKIEKTAKENSLSLQKAEIIDIPENYEEGYIIEAIKVCKEGKMQAIMKGNLHTDELMKQIVSKNNGLRTDSRLSHIFYLKTNNYHKPFMITDAAININPDFQTKLAIVKNSINLAHSLGIKEPKVALLSAVEHIYHKLPSTIDAAAICKMADRNQFHNAIIDGPLAFDNAVSKEAAEYKKINSPVAGDVDIFVMPDIEAGNILAKQFVYLAGADIAGVVLGAKVPIILTSRADTAQARLASSALAILYYNFEQKGAS